MPQRGDRRFQYRGDLAEKSLPEVLYSIDRFQVPGVVSVERAGVVKEIHIRDGHVVHAASSDLADSLGSYLHRSGRLDAETFHRTMRLRRDSDRRFGALLIEEGILAPAEVYRGIREQIEQIVWSLFYWQEGEVSFALGDFPNGGRVRLELPMRRVILEGIKRAPRAKELVGRLGHRDTVYQPAYDAETLIEIGLDADEHALLSLIDGQRSLYRVFEEGPFSASDNAKRVYAFQVLRLIHRPEVGENPAVELGADGSEPARAAGDGLGR